MDEINEINAMLHEVERRAAELKVPSLVLIGLLTHHANVQSAMVHAQMMASRRPTVAEQIMGGRANG